MITHEQIVPDLIIEECIPDCNECPGSWINTDILHRIVCRCNRCKHGQNQKAGLGALAKTAASNNTTRPEPRPGDING